MRVAFFVILLGLGNSLRAGGSQEGRALEIFFIDVKGARRR